MTGNSDTTSVVISVHTSNTVDLGFELEIRIMCPYVAIYLPPDCCFSVRTLSKSNQACSSSTKWVPIVLSSHRNVTCSSHDIADKWYKWL